MGIGEKLLQGISGRVALLQKTGNTVFPEEIFPQLSCMLDSKGGLIGEMPAVLVLRVVKDLNLFRVSGNDEDALLGGYLLFNELTDRLTPGGVIVHDLLNILHKAGMQADPPEKVQRQ